LKDDDEDEYESELHENDEYESAFYTSDEYNDYEDIENGVLV
jgi:hypothetical protein